MKTYKEGQFEHAFRISLGEKVRKVRRDRDFTQADLSDKIGISRPSLANIEKGQQSVSSFQLLILARSLDVEPEKLLPNYEETSAIYEEIKKSNKVSTSSKLLAKALEEQGVNVTEQKLSTLKEVISEFTVKSPNKAYTSRR